MFILYIISNLHNIIRKYDDSFTDKETKAQIGQGLITSDISYSIRSFSKSLLVSCGFLLIWHLGREGHTCCLGWEWAGGSLKYSPLIGYTIDVGSK